MRVTFYLPERYWPDHPDRAAWESGTVARLKQSGKAASAQCWIYQTWAAVTATGAECRLSTGIPQDGILIALSGFFGADWLPPEGVFFADVVADFLPHPAARLHIVQNRAHANRLPRSVFMPHWPQPSLTPRDPARGAAFENICFLGDPANLAPELRDPRWAASLLRDTGLRLDVRGADRWHDYRDVDCALAIRDFSRSRQLHKPATKLYNAWLAGVPFIGGRDSAYAADGRPGVDHLRAGSPDEVRAHLRRLAGDPGLRERIVAEGQKSSAGFSRDATLRRWRKLVQETLPAAASKHAAGRPLTQTASAALHRMVLHIDRRLR